MTMHPAGASIHFDLPAVSARPSVMSSSHLLAVDVSVCEWTADLSTPSARLSTAERTSAVATGFVDFDAIDSVHEAVRPTIRR